MLRVLTSVLLLAVAPPLMAGQLIDPPKSTGLKERTQLGYIDSHDAVDGKDYACLVYKEEHTRKEEWKLKVKLKGGVSRTTSINPDSSSFRRSMSEAAQNGKEYFLWGYHLEPDEGDARRIENRIYFSDSGQPESLRVHLVTRNSDGTPKEPQIARVKWPEAEDVKLLSAPESDGSTTIEELAYVDSYDVIAARRYAYLAYKEMDNDSGEWSVRIKGNVTASTTINPDSGPLRTKIRDAAKAGKNYVVWGFHMEPRDNDPRLVETRIYFDKSRKPSAVEIHLVTRQADGAPGDKQVARFDWPA